MRLHPCPSCTCDIPAHEAEQRRLEALRKRDAEQRAFAGRWGVLTDDDVAWLHTKVVTS